MTLDNKTDNTTSPEVNQEGNSWLLPVFLAKFFRKEVLPVVTDLRLAITLLLVIAVFSISGTVIEQGQSPVFYQANYPEHPALFGFLTWKVIQVVGLDHVYRTWWFLGLLVLFGTSLTACTFTRQLPALKAAKKWQYYDDPRKFNKLALSAELEKISLEKLTPILIKNRYKLFTDNEKQADQKILYARKGIIGRIGPIIVHIGIVTILLGGIWGAMTGFMAQEMIASGNNFQVTNIIDAGPWSSENVLKDWSVTVNRFWIDYTPTGAIDQFYSDMSVIDKSGQEVDHEKIYVNKPLRYHGVVFYQTDWGISAVKVRLNKSPIFQLPMALLDTQGKGRIWGTWIPTKPDLSEGVSLLAKDLQGMVLVYNSDGNLINTVRAGGSIPVNGVNLKVIDVVGSTGLQIKYDPGIPIVYCGFAVLMLGVVMSYFSHSQVWALQVGDKLYIGGKTNRAQVAFEREIIDILEQLS
ncbi:cytochrome c biogenesis protein [Anabaena sp. FACHB-1237]|uniref:cytochrome c biogenesis protein n=1 Tax=Anabaena sp. FACHB-1237 TaxID=2692769 RepID=UPI001681289C|nr:cytochrome c biogenesis protein [Anabaena sp. FACHB-1237]MBD2136589.1 cytochrome c biogenesis protein [Anabaena sp. FACHB-1237]